MSDTVPPPTTLDVAPIGDTARPYLALMVRDEVRRCLSRFVLLGAVTAAVGVLLGAVLLAGAQRAGWVVLRP